MCVFLTPPASQHLTKTTHFSQFTSTPVRDREGLLTTVNGQSGVSCPPASHAAFCAVYSYIDALHWKAATVRCVMGYTVHAHGWGAAPALLTVWGRMSVFVNV